MPKKKYGVFLSHNSLDKPLVESLARKLQESGLRPWLDNWNLIPGIPWQPEIEKALQECLSCAVLLGKHGSGPWQLEEMRAAINRRVQQSKGVFPVIPVLLPGARKSKGLPPFLTATTWVKFRRTINDQQAFQKLILGIRGGRPESTNGKHQGRVDVIIKIAVSTNKFKKVIAEAEKFLKDAAGDGTLRINYTKSGSTLLGIQCSQAGYERLNLLIASGKTRDVMGYRIDGLYREIEAGLQQLRFQTRPKPTSRTSAGGLTKTQLVRNMAERMDIQNKTAAAFLEHLAATAIKETKTTGVFVIPGLGRLVRSSQRARMGRNIQTGEPIKIAAKRVVKFRVSKSVRDAIAPRK